MNGGDGHERPTKNVFSVKDNQKEYLITSEYYRQKTMRVIRVNNEPISAIMKIKTDGKEDVYGKGDSDVCITTMST